MKDWPRGHAAANIRCPHCGMANTIVFNIGTGKIVDVAVCDEPLLTAVPSRN
jgi:hypothetical protein